LIACGKLNKIVTSWTEKFYFVIKGWF